MSPRQSLGAEDAQQTAPAGDAPPPATDDGAAGEVARLVSYIALLLVAIMLYIAAGSLPTSQWEPLGAGAFPKLVFGLLAGLCVTAIVLSLRRLARLGMPGSWGARSLDWVRAHRLVILVFAAFGLYLLALRGLGFSLATFVFLLVAQLIIAPRNRRSTLIALVIAVVFSFGLNWIFAEVFLVFLPRGPLG